MNIETENDFELEYVVLGYAQDSVDNTTLPVVVACRIITSPPAGGLGLHTILALVNAIQPRHRTYLHELLDCWRETEVTKLPDLFKELGELSTGPLRTVEKGHCSREAYPHLLSTILGRQEEFRKV
jgi:hypothetical protein